MGRTQLRLAIPGAGSESLIQHLNHRKLDTDAVAITARLQREGYTAYLVGGCVRDLLLGGTPKDFDIATTAKPEELKAVFGRRCRLIGRRFKLAHIRAGSQVFEVATFRGPPEHQEVVDDSGFVVRANTYGTPHEDALSRDFTINGLFYDPSSRQIHDFVGGRADIEARRIRTIGDPEQRFREDPVRLMRAVKFAARLGLNLDDEIVKVAKACAPLVHDCPSARVTEEFFRIFETGHARRSLQLMQELDILPDLLPEVATSVLTDDTTWKTALTWLDAVDRQRHAHSTLPRECMYTLLVWPIIYAALQKEQAEGVKQDWGKRASELSHSTNLRMGIPQRHRHQLRSTANVMKRLIHPSKRTRRAALMRTPALPVALSLLRMQFIIDGSGADVYETWASAAASHGIRAAPVEPRVEETGKDHRRRPAR